MPENKGDSSITSYVVEMADTSDGEFSEIDKTDSITFMSKVRSLEKEKQYLVRVFAVTWSGRSEPAYHEPVSLQSGEFSTLEILPYTVISGNVIRYNY